MAWLEYVLPLIFLFPLGATAVIVLALRNLHDARVRSPFNARPLQEPGQALRDRLDRAFASLFLNGALGPIVTLAPLVYGMGRMLFANQQNWIEWALYGTLSTLLVLAFCFLLIRDYQQIRRIKLALGGALAVGQELERLVRPETHPYCVFHAVPTDSDLIDHVAVTPHGVFVVETLARARPYSANGEELGVVSVETQRLRFPGWSERDPLEKTRRATRWLGRWLQSRCGAPVPVRGVLALPGWEIRHEGAPDELFVVSGESLATQLSETPLEPLDETLHDRAIAALVERLAQHEQAREAERVQRP